MDEARRALRPFERVIVFLGGLILVGTLLQLANLLSGESSFLGLGTPDVCVSVTPWSSDAFHGIEHVRAYGLSPDTRAVVDTVELCRTGPSHGQRLLYSVDQGAAWLFGLGVIFLLWRLLRHGRRQGVFVQSFARRLTGLGLYVLLGMAVVYVARAWAEGKLVRSLMPGSDAGLQWQFSFLPLLIGLGLITLGRVVAATVPMREELDATV